MWLYILACAAPAPSPAADPCDGPGAPAACVDPDHGAEWYVTQSLAYFDTMDFTVEDLVFPPYGEMVVRWEWPPWLKLTGYTREGIEASDMALRLYPSTIPERDCRFFPENPFGRCYVVFYYDAYPGRPCPIYEEFTFDAQGNITWIEAWSDLPGMRPMPEDDPWAEGDEVSRLGSRIPGLGTPDGRIDPKGEPLQAAAADDPDVADFVARTDDWFAAWLDEWQEQGEDAFPIGCGWEKK